MANRLRLDIEETARLVSPPIAGVEILRLRNPSELVRRIFDRYREKSRALEEKLSEDAFFSYLARTLDNETTALSKNPMFLTIMCYLYVKGIDNEGATQPEAILNLRSLVTICVHILLVDLDEYRVRKLPTRVRTALIEKRGLYAEKKFEFLRFLASRLFIDQRYVERPAITESDIRELARQFFTSVRRDAEVDEILRNLESQD